MTSFVVTALFLTTIYATPFRIDEGARSRAIIAANNLQCSYTNYNGLFDFELLWQAGNTLETLSNYVVDDILLKSQLQDLLNNTYYMTPTVVDNCYDDNQWWLLAWVSAYEATDELAYLQRAAQVFDYVVEHAWTDVCGGGVMWCPTSDPASEYKNAVTNELFLAAATRLSQYEALLPGAPTGYYLGWARKEWAWFQGSGLINADGLINDGLDTATCTNNRQTTWTYNQGVLLDALGLLSSATGDRGLLQLSESIAYAAMTHLVADSTSSILAEPCGDSCNGDQQIFKGVFVRHLGRLVPMMTNRTVKAKATSFLSANADTVVSNASSTIGGYGLLWQGPNAATSTVAELSAVADLFDAAAINGWAPATPGMAPLGLGACVDGAGDSMPACVAQALSEADCSAARGALTDAVAYDYSTPCFEHTQCRVYSRTASSATCAKLGTIARSWTFQDGNATSVTSTDKKSRNYDKTICILANAAT